MRLDETCGKTPSLPYLLHVPSLQHGCGFPVAPALASRLHHLLSLAGTPTLHRHTLNDHGIDQERWTVERG